MSPLLILLLSSLAASQPSTAPATQPAPLVAISERPGMPGPGQDWHPTLSIGIWDDGTIVWSEGKAGPPYRTAKVDRQSVEKLMTDLDAAGLFDDPELNRNKHRYPPDAGYTAMAANWGDKRQRLGYWREIPNDRFGEVWKASEKLIRALKPDKGEPIEKIDPKVYQLGWPPGR